MKSLIVPLFSFVMVCADEIHQRGNLLDFSPEEVKSAMLINNPEAEEQEMHPLEDVLDRPYDSVESSVLNKLEAPFA